MRTFSLVVVFIAFFGVRAELNAEDLVTLRNEDGKEIRCSITGFREDLVYLRRDDGWTFKYAYELLDEASQGIVRNRIIELNPPSLRVKSVANSRSDVDSSYDQSEEPGVSVSTTTNERIWEVKVSSHSPFVEEVTVEIYSLTNSGVTREVEQGKVAYGADWTLKLKSESISIKSVSENLYRSQNESEVERVRNDIVVYLRSSQNEIMDSFTTSAFTQRELEKRIPSLKH